MNTPRNPWIRQHIESEVAFQDENRDLAAYLVLNEYRDCPEPIPCLCSPNAQAFYKATIGAMKCSDCNRLFTTQGDPIR